MKQIKILIIDDDAIVLKSCMKIFRKKEEYCIDTAISGTEGLKAAKNEKYDLIITDLKMPQISGMEVLKTIKKEQPDVTVIVFTGYATVETAREALKLGAFDYVPKPFKPEELRDVVGNAVKNRQHDATAKTLDLMAIVGHELKSPVAALHTTAETMYKGYFGKLPPEQQKVMETILRNCQYLEDTIRNYLDMAKMDMDNIESFKKKIDLIKDVIQPVVENPVTRDNTKHINLTTDLKISSPEIFGDTELLKIVISNLINNAVKYGKSNTAVLISVFEIQDYNVVSVYNEGVGISKDDIKNKLFGKFVRLKQKGTEGVKGSGLGLYICNKIIEKHRGKIGVESEEGSWSKFSVFLPKK